MDIDVTERKRSHDGYRRGEKGEKSRKKDSLVLESKSKGGVMKLKGYQVEVEVAIK